MAVVVAAPAGLHARPAIRLSRLVKQFRANVRVRGDGDDWVDAKSIVRLMALRVAEGGRLQFSARGEEAAQAIAAVGELIARNFEDTGGTGGA